MTVIEAKDKFPRHIIVREIKHNNQLTGRQAFVCDNQLFTGKIPISICLACEETLRSPEQETWFIETLEDGDWFARKAL